MIDIANHELSAYLVGRLPVERRREIERLAAQDEELAAKIAVLRQILNLPIERESQHLEQSGARTDLSAMADTTPIGQEGLRHQPFWPRLWIFVTPFDSRYEDLRKGPWHLNVFRDFSAGLIVAMMAIPTAMGFAMAAGLKPEQGIVGGAIAGLVGALFGGSKHQVYGPAVTLVPAIAGLMAAYGAKYDFATAQGMLVLCSITAGIVLMGIGITGVAKFARCVPHSVVVGFILGIAVLIGTSQLGGVLGLRSESGHHGFVTTLQTVWNHLDELNGNALLLAVVTYLCMHYLRRISNWIPAPLIAIGVGILLCSTMPGGDSVILVKTMYGPIGMDFFRITPPALPAWDWSVLKDIATFSALVVSVSSVESLLCLRMADRLADNRGTPANTDKEMWGQGIIQIVVPLLNGFPHTGSFVQTAANIKLGAVTPLAEVFKCFLKLFVAYCLASSLGLVPIACIGAMVMWIAVNMVSMAVIKSVLVDGWFDVTVMIITALVVILVDLLAGLLVGMVVYAVFFSFFDRRRQLKENEPAMEPPGLESEAAHVW